MSKYHSDEDIQALYQRHIDMLFRICYSYMKNIADSEDAISNTFLKYIQTDIEFQSIEHEKAWLITTATHICQDMLKHWWRRNKIFNEQTSVSLETFTIDSTLDVILKLPNRYKTVIYLYYYEEYNTEEIAQILHIPSSTVRNQLSRARKLLKKKLGDNNE